MLKDELKIVNIGLEAFFEVLMELGVEAVHVDWRPPAGGDQEMLDILSELL